MFKNSILTNNKKKVDVTKNGKGFLAARVQSPSVQLFRCAILVLFSNVLSQTLDYFWKHVHTLQIPDSHYEKEKKLKTGKNLHVLSKSLLVTVARTWDSLRFSMSRKVFNTGKFWLILSKNYKNLYKFKYLGSAFPIDCNGSAFAIDCNSSISFCDCFIFIKLCHFLPLF